MLGLAPGSYNQTAVQSPGINLRAFAPVWRQFYQELVAEVRALIVDDEKSGSQLAEALSAGGYESVQCETAEVAWERIRDERFDLAVVDYALPDENGIRLISRLRAKGHSLPCVLTTSEERAEIVSKALEVGADDYLAKPYGNIAHCVQRMQSLVDRRITKSLFEVIIRDLSEAVRQGGMAEDGLAALSRDLFGFKVSLDKRPQAMVFDNDEFEGGALAKSLQGHGVTTAVASNHEQLFGAIRSETGPLTVVLSLEVPNAILTIKRLKSEDAQVEVLATAEGADVEQAVAAVNAGATDFVLRSREGLTTLGSRVSRVVSRCREHRLYLYLLTSLHRTAKKYNPELADDLVFARNREDVTFIRSSRPSESPPVPKDFTIQQFRNS